MACLPKQDASSTSHSSMSTWKPLISQQYDPLLARVEAPSLDLNFHFFPPFLFFILAFSSISGTCLCTSSFNQCLSISKLMVKKVSGHAGLLTSGLNVAIPILQEATEPIWHPWEDVHFNPLGKSCKDPASSEFQWQMVGVYGFLDTPASKSITVFTS